MQYVIIDLYIYDVITIECWFVVLHVFCLTHKHTVTLFCLSCHCSYEDIDDARSKFRIFTTSAVMLFALVGSIIYIREGKKIKREGGDSLYGRNKARYEQDSHK